MPIVVLVVEGACARAVEAAVARGLSGLDHFAGVPSKLGGASGRISTSSPTGGRDGVLLEATLPLAAVDPHALLARVEASLAWRRGCHPAAAAMRSAGCVFRSPPGSPAVSLSLASPRQLLSLGAATAADAVDLIALIRDRVAEHRGVRLEPEHRL